MNDGYEKLAMAIVEMAVLDYKEALEHFSKDPWDNAARAQIKKLRRFFNSGYFTLLCDLDPEMLMRRIEEAYV